jgi:hypothetical protein
MWLVVPAAVRSLAVLAVSVARVSAYAQRLRLEAIAMYFERGAGG